MDRVDAHGFYGKKGSIALKLSFLLPKGLNIQLLFVLVVLSVFVIIDTLQIALYPFILFGGFAEIRRGIETQLPTFLKNLHLGFVLSLLVINVFLRVLTIISILQNKRPVVMTILSNGFTILLVTLVLTANALWEAVVMLILTALLIWGNRKRSLEGSQITRMP